MITLYTFGPNVELPDPSPFVLKTMIQLKMAGLSYETDSRFARFRAAPKGKLPYLDDDGTIIADSAFIRQHIESKYGYEFDAGLDARERATAFAVTKMLEEGYYWIGVHTRWIEADNWQITKAALFAKIPMPLRAIIPGVAQRTVVRNLFGQGTGRHKPEEIFAIGKGYMRALSDLLGDRPALMGDKPCGADATVLAVLMGTLTPAYRSPVGDAVRQMPNLMAYVDRWKPVYF